MPTNEHEQDAKFNQIEQQNQSHIQSPGAKTTMEQTSEQSAAAPALAKPENQQQRQHEQQQQLVIEDNCHHYVYDGQELRAYDSTSGTYSMNEAPANDDDDDEDNNNNNNINNNNNNNQQIKRQINKHQSLDRFPLPFVDPPEMSDEDQMFANFNHFQIIWSDLSYKIEPKWYKKIGFINQFLSCGQSGLSSQIDSSSATSTTSSSPSAFTDNTPISSPRSPLSSHHESRSTIIASPPPNLPPLDNSTVPPSVSGDHSFGGVGGATIESKLHKSASGHLTDPDSVSGQERLKTPLGQETIEIFSHLNGTIKSGQLTAILGPSGAGKTSLLNCLTGKLRKGVSGHVNLVGALGKQLKICTIPQKDHLLDLLTVEENLWFASKIKNPEYGFDHAKNIERVVGLLGLKRCRAAKIKKISGGQHKRVSIAQELLSNPDILVLDEPTSGLDSLTCYKTISMLRDLVELSANNEYMKPMAIIVTIHQPQPKVFNLFHHVYILANGGRIIYEGNPTSALDTVMEVTGLQPLDESTTTKSSPEVSDVTAGSIAVGKVLTASKSAGGLAAVAAQNIDPASFLIEIASEEYGSEAIDKLHSYQRDQFYRVHRVADLQRDNRRRAREQAGGGGGGGSSSSSQPSTPMSMRQSCAENMDLHRSFNNPAFNGGQGDETMIQVVDNGQALLQQHQHAAIFDEKTMSTRSSLSGSSSFNGSNNDNHTITTIRRHQDGSIGNSSSTMTAGDEPTTTIDLESALKRRRRRAVYKVNQLDSSHQTTCSTETRKPTTTSFWSSLFSRSKQNNTNSENQSSHQSNNNNNNNNNYHHQTYQDNQDHKFGRKSSVFRDTPVSITITTDSAGQKARHIVVNEQPGKLDRAQGGAACSSQAGSCSNSAMSKASFLYVSDQLLHTRDSNHRGKFWSHTATLARRTFLTTRRDPLLMTSRVLFHLMIPILMAHVYGQSTGKANACPNYEPEIDITQIPSLVESKRVESMLEELHMSIENVSMFFIIMYAFSAAVLALNALSFPLNMQVLLKETRNGWYNMSSYVVAKTLADLPLELTMPSITMALVYPLTGQPSSYLEWRMLTICLIMTLCSLIAQTQALIIGALVMNSVQTAVFVSQASQLPWVILAGFTIRIKRLSEPLKVISLTSFYRLGCEAITLTRYGFGICPCNPKEITGQPVKLVGIPEQVRVMAQHWLESRASTSSGDADAGGEDFGADDNSTEIVTTTLAPLASSLTRTTRDILTTLSPSDLINNAVTSLADNNKNNSSTLISNSHEHETTSSISSNKADIFQHLANQLSYANSYGVNITSCADVTPDRIRAINLGDNWLVARIWHLFLMLIIMKILLYYAVTFSIRIRL